jgi:hypothetical protein
MAAHHDQLSFPRERSTGRNDAQVLRWRTVSPAADGKMADAGTLEKLRPARGLVFGLFIGALLWAAILVFAWQFFRK